MLGPLFGFSDDDLVRLRARAEEIQKQQGENAPQRHQPLWCAAAHREQRGRHPFYRKSPGVYARLTELRRMARSAPAEQLLEEIFCFHRLSCCAGVLENGARRREMPGVCGFLCTAGANGSRRWSRAIDGGGAGRFYRAGHCARRCAAWLCDHHDHPPLQGAAVPRWLLRWPDTARRFNAADTRQPVLLHRMYGAGLRLRPEEGEGAYKTAAYTALSNVHAAEMRSEQMRLLYVALTRAQDKLILTVPLGIGKTSNPFTRAAAFLEAGRVRRSAGRRTVLPTGSVRPCSSTPTAALCAGWPRIWNCPLRIPGAPSP